jgi:hypothetical protein
MEGIGVDYFRDERIIHMWTSRLHGEIGSQSSGATRECEDSSCFADEAFDFPPTVYPGRELFAFGLFVLAIMTFVVWGGWRLVSLILMSMIYTAKSHGSLIRWWSKGSLTARDHALERGEAK